MSRTPPSLISISLPELSTPLSSSFDDLPREQILELINTLTSDLAFAREACLERERAFNGLRLFCLEKGIQEKEIEERLKETAEGDNGGYSLSSTLKARNGKSRSIDKDEQNESSFDLAGLTEAISEDFDFSHSGLRPNNDDSSNSNQHIFPLDTRHPSSTSRLDLNNHSQAQRIQNRHSSLSSRLFGTASSTLFSTSTSPTSSTSSSIRAATAGTSSNSVSVQDVAGYGDWIGWRGWKKGTLSVKATGKESLEVSDPVESWNDPNSTTTTTSSKVQECLLDEADQSSRRATSISDSAIQPSEDAISHSTGTSIFSSQSPPSTRSQSRTRNSSIASTGVTNSPSPKGPSDALLSPLSAVVKPTLSTVDPTPHYSTPTRRGPPLSPSISSSTDDLDSSISSLNAEPTRRRPNLHLNLQPSLTLFPKLPSLSSKYSPFTSPSLATVRLPEVGIVGGEDYIQGELSSSTSMSQLSSSSNHKSSSSEGPKSTKVLLSQLAEIHDNVGREQREAWENFIRRRQKILAGGLEDSKQDTSNLKRSRDGMAEDGTDNSSSMIDFEKDLVGVAQMGITWKTGKEDWQEFKSLVKKGIPVIYRPKIWAECSGSNEVREPGAYEETLSRHLGEKNECSMQIELDCHRTFPTNAFFAGNGPGVTKLRNVLIAYSGRNPTIGYCQGMNNLAATLLLIYPAEEDAFWVLVCIIEKILPSDYYSSLLLVSRADQRVFQSLVARNLPELAAHLEELEVQLPSFSFGWFLSLFTTEFPTSTLLRIWDLLLVFGTVILFRTAFAILQLHSVEILKCDSAGSLYALMRSLTTHLYQVDKLVSIVCDDLRTVIKDKEVEALRSIHVEELRREMEEQNVYAES